jgi:hypothetical protein
MFFSCLCYIFIFNPGCLPFYPSDEEIRTSVFFELAKIENSCRKTKAVIKNIGHIENEKN